MCTIQGAPLRAPCTPEGAVPKHPNPCIRRWTCEGGTLALWEIELVWQKKIHRRIIAGHKYYLVLKTEYQSSVPVVVRCKDNNKHSIRIKHHTTSNNIQESSQASVGGEDLAWKWFICNSYPSIPISCLIITKIWWLVFILAWSVLVLPKVQEWGRWICRWTFPLVNNVYFLLTYLSICREDQ